jgi:4-hydroxyphenylpyruvate dioxygenase-like putative hemolysin
LLTILGVWYEGGIAKDAEWKARVAELETKVAQAEAKSAQVNTKVVTKVVTKTQVIKEKGDEVVRYIDREITKYDSECKIPQVAIKAHDASALNKTIDEVILNPSSVIGTTDHNALAAPKAKKSWRDHLPK